MKQSYKQSFALLCITLLASQSVFGIMTNPSRVAGVHPKHRRLSQMGMLDLSIDGRGYFAFALRVKAPGADAGNDESMATPGSANYDSAYGTGAPGPQNTAASSGMQADGAKANMCTYTAKVDEACAKTAAAAAAGTCAINAGNDGCDYDADGAGAVSAAAADTDGTNCDYTAPVTESCKDSLGAVDALCTASALSSAATCVVTTDGDNTACTAANADSATCVAADALGTGLAANLCIFTAEVTAAAAEASCVATKDGIAAVGAENNDGSDTGHYLQVVYSRDGSLHINRYGFLVDDNGLLLLGAAAKSNTDPADESATSVAKEAIHIPSRTDEIIVTTTGKVISKTDGAVFTQVGQLKLTRFANPMGLNVRLNMRSRCSSMNEIGFSLGNWCSGTPLDGKAHEYLVETEVSGAGEVANPGDSGYGNIVQ